VIRGGFWDGDVKRELGLCTHICCGYVFAPLGLFHIIVVLDMIIRAWLFTGLILDLRGLNMEVLVYELHSEYNRCECKGLWTIYRVCDYIRVILELVSEAEYDL